MADLTNEEARLVRISINMHRLNLLQGDRLHPGQLHLREEADALGSALKKLGLDGRTPLREVDNLRERRLREFLFSYRWRG